MTQFATLRCASAVELEESLTREATTPLLVELGTGLETQADAVELVRAFLTAADGRDVALVTRRGSVSQSIPQLLCLIREFPDLRLCLDFGEIYFGSEALLGQWSDWKRAFRELSPNIAYLVSPSGGAERTRRTGGLVESFLSLVVASRFRWLRRQVDTSVRMLPSSVE